MAEKLTDKTPASTGESSEPKRLYVAFYDPHTEENDHAFKRAAQTWKAGIEGAPGFREGIDEVKLVEAGTDNEFIQQWNKEAKYSHEKEFAVKEVIVFGHASAPTGQNRPGVEFTKEFVPSKHHPNGKTIDADGDTTVDKADIKELSIFRWDRHGILTLAGCNSGNSYFNPVQGTAAQEFARSQGVPTIGNQGFSTFSSDPEEHVATNPESPVMYLWPYNRTQNTGDWGAFRGNEGGFLSESWRNEKAIPAVLLDKNGKLVPESEHAQYFLKHGVKTTGPMTLEDRRAHYLLQELIRNSTKAVPTTEAPDTAPEQTPKGTTPVSASGSLNAQGKVVSQEHSSEVLRLPGSYLGLSRLARSEWLPTRFLEHAQVSIQGARQGGFENDPGTRYANTSDLTLSPQQQAWITQILPKWHATIEAHPNYAQEQKLAARDERNASWEQAV